MAAQPVVASQHAGLPRHRRHRLCPARRRRPGLARHRTDAVRARQPRRGSRAEQQSGTQPARMEGAHRHRRTVRAARGACIRLRHGHQAAGARHGRTRCLHPRRDRRGDTRGGGAADPGTRADPVCAAHRHRARGAAVDGAPGDQQVLHHRHRPRPQHDRVLRRPGPAGVHHLLAQPPMPNTGTGASTRTSRRSSMRWTPSRRSPGPAARTCKAAVRAGSWPRRPPRTWPLPDTATGLPG